MGGHIHRGKIRGIRMTTVRVIVCILILVCIGVQASFGETYVVDVYDLYVGISPVGAANPFDLGAELVGITSVSVRVIGVGGGGNFECQGGVPDGWYDLDVRIAFGKGWFVFSTSNQVAFDVTSELEFNLNPNPWLRCEGTTQCALPVTAYAQGTQYSDCWTTDVVVPLISHVEVTIIADSVVSSDSVSWGTIKALYSGGQ
jgi:hypothetical protein